MKRKARNYFITLGILILLAVSFSAGCAALNPGTEQDPGEAVGAPTMPEDIDEAYDEGSGYPEESM